MERAFADRLPVSRLSFCLARPYRVLKINEYGTLPNANGR